jgi:TetR/AcrR family transcriptional repressor of mexJK operon
MTKTSDEAGASAKRGRPSRSEAQAIDQQVLDAAFECFLDAGFDRTTMEAVADRAGVSKPTLYLRHPDKIALLEAVLRERMRQWEGLAPLDDPARGETLKDRLLFYARRLLARGQEQPIRALVRLLEGSWGPARTIAETYQRLLRAPMRDKIAEELVEFGERDHLPPQHPHRAASMFLGLLQGFLLFESIEDADAETLASYAEQVVEVFLKGRRGW